MSTETLKIALAQKILAISDIKLLKKVKSLIENESVIGYEVNNTPISVNNYVQEMDLSIKAIENKLNKDFADLCDWFVENKLSIHFGQDKTKSILFVNKYKLSLK